MEQNDTYQIMLLINTEQNTHCHRKLSKSFSKLFPVHTAQLSPGFDSSWTHCLWWTWFASVGHITVTVRIGAQCHYIELCYRVVSYYKYCDTDKNTFRY